MARRKPPAPGIKAGGSDLNAAARAINALELRKQGATYEVIARECGYGDRGAAYNAIKRELARSLREPADDVRKLEVDRLDDLFKVYYAMALNGDGWSMDRVLRIMERRAAFLGLDTRPDTQTAGSIVVEIPSDLAAAIRGVPALASPATNPATLEALFGATGGAS